LKEKYGFVYMWYDSLRKMYYIGSHWGFEDDGYICSSNRMRDAYRRRPQDFKRRILSRLTSTRAELLEEEFRWLSMIPTEELGKKYYNLRTHHPSHWSTDPDASKTIKEKLSEAATRNHTDPEWQARYQAGLKTRDNKSSDPVVRDKRRQSMKSAMAKKFPEDQRHKPVSKDSEEYKEKMREAASKRWAGHVKKEPKPVNRDENGKYIQTEEQKANLAKGRQKGKKFNLSEEARKARSERAKAQWAARKALNSSNEM